MGAFGASAVVLTPLLPANTPALDIHPGHDRWRACCAARSGVLSRAFSKPSFNVNEVISTLMMNYIAISWNNYLIYAVWTEGGFQMSKVFPKTAWLPRLTDYAEQVPALPRADHPLWA